MFMEVVFWCTHFPGIFFALKGHLITAQRATLGRQRARPFSRISSWAVIKCPFRARPYSERFLRLWAKSIVLVNTTATVTIWPEFFPEAAASLFPGGSVYETSQPGSHTTQSTPCCTPRINSLNFPYQKGTTGTKN